MEACADCKTAREVETMFSIVPPEGHAKYGEVFFLCTFCWDRLIGLATMAAIR